MNAGLRQLAAGEFPPLLREIPDPPAALWLRGAPPSPEYKLLAIVGSRKHTPYGKAACERIITGLAGAPVTVVSGLALGLDAVAHRASLAAGIPTIAVPGSGLSPDALYPRGHRGLAEEIVKAGGALLSEFEPDFTPRPESFPQRNRIMAGMSHAVLVVEAAERSGSLITARLATEYNRDVLAVPGSIFSSASRGTNTLIKLGAAPVRVAEDALESLGVELQAPQERRAEPDALSERERAVLAALEAPQTRDELIRSLALPAHEANTLIAELELKGIIEEKLGAIHRRV